MAIVTSVGVAVNVRSRAGLRLQAAMTKALGDAQASGVVDPVKLRREVLVAREIANARAVGIDLKPAEALAKLKAG